MNEIEELPDTSTLTLDRLEDISLLLLFYLVSIFFALKPKIHSVIFKLFHRCGGLSLDHASLFLSLTFFFKHLKKKKKHQNFVIMAVDHLCLLFNEKIQFVSSSVIKNTVNFILNCTISYFYT